MFSSSFTGFTMEFQPELACLAAARGRHQRALWLDAVADTLRRATGLVRSPVEITMVHRWIAPAEQAPQPALREHVRVRAATMTLEDTVTHALGVEDSSAAPNEEALLRNR